MLLFCFGIYEDILIVLNNLKKKFKKTDYNKLLELLYQLRSAQGLRQSDLADKLGVPQSFISKIESGERKIDIVTFIYICEGLNVSPIEAFTQFINKIHATTPIIPKSK